MEDVKLLKELVYTIRSEYKQGCYYNYSSFLPNFDVVNTFISNDNSTTISSAIICSLTELCMKVIPVLVSSQQKQCFKILGKLFGKYANLFRNSIDAWIDRTISFGVLELNQLIFLSLLIDEVKQSHEILATNLPKLLSIIVSTLIKLTESEQASWDICLKSSKLFLQIFRTFRADLTKILSHPNFTSYQQCFISVANICLKLINYLKNECSNASKFLGNVMACMLSYHNDFQKAHKNLEKIVSTGNGECMMAEIMPGVIMSINGKQLLHTSFWIFNGVLSCYPKILFQENASSALVASSFYTITNVCAPELDLQYHGFSALHMWFKQLLRSPCVTKSFVEPKVISLTIELVWKNWDSQIVGGVDILMQTFSALLDVLNIIDPSHFNDFISHLVETPSHVKGRYGPLSILINKFGYERILESDPQFIGNLFDVLGINHLASSVSKVYKAIVSNGFKGPNNTVDVVKWEAILGKPLVKALLCTLPSIQQNALSYLVPVSLNLHSSVLPKLLRCISITATEDGSVTADTELAAVVGVLKVARSSGVVQFHEIDREVLQQAFCSYANDTRARAFWIVCKGPKKSAPVVEEELNILYEQVPLNMNSDCSPFRHEFLFCISATLERIQCSVIAAAKQDNVVYTKVCLDFVSWLLQLCMDSLQICFTYQRKSTALFAYKLLLNHLCFNDETLAKKKWMCKEEWDTLEKVLRRSDINLLSTSMASTLLYLVSDVVPEIRETVLEIISQYFLPTITMNFKCSMREKCLSLLKSPKAQDTESGALLAQFYFTHITDMVSTQDNSFRETLTSDIKHEQSFQFLRQLYDFVQTSYRDFGDDFLQSAHNSPFHGWLLALSFCLNSFSSFWDAIDSLSDELWTFLNNVIVVLSNIVHFFLNHIFSCSDSEQASCNENQQYAASADFREMSNRICHIICDSKQSDNDKHFPDDEDILLSSDFEVVLSGSWLALKNACMTLSSWGCYILGTKIVEFVNFKELEMHLNSVCSLFATVLSMCRHRGVIESCYLSFVKYLTSLFHSKKFCNLPKTLLRLLLESQNQRRDSFKLIEGGSITRRSAGIPLVIDAILTANVAASYSSDMLPECIQVLLDSLVYLKEMDEKMICVSADLPQVDALYILKSIFQNNKLGPYVTVHLPAVFIATLNCLGSSLWVVRNASVCLLSILSSRMLGQKHIEKKFSNSLTAFEFFARYPNLLHYFHQIFNDGIRLSKTTSSTEIWDQEQYFLKPSIYPIVSLLSKLVYSDTGSQNDLDISFVAEATKELIVCRFFPVRTITAELMLVLYSTEDIVSLISQYIRSLPEHPDSEDLRQNELHGWLNLTLMVVSRSREESQAETSALCQLLINRKWLALLTYNPCPFTAALYLNVVVVLIETNYIESAFIDCKHVIEDIFTELKVKIGIEDYAKAFIKYIIATGDFTAFEMLMKIVCDGSISNSNLVRKHCFELLAESSKLLKQHGSNLIPYICNLWKRQKQCSVLVEVAVMSLLVKLKPFEQKEKGDNLNLEIISSHIFTASFHNCLSLKCVRLKSMACVILWEIAMGYSIYSIANHINMWVNELDNSTFLSRAPEPLRLSAAESLNDAGATILNWIQQHCSTSHHEVDKVKLLNSASLVCHSSLLLLHDEQSEIREPVCAFAASLQTCQKTSQLQHNYATKVILAYFVEKFSSTELLDKLMLLCTNATPPSLTTNQSLYRKEAFNFYVEFEQMALIVENYAQDVAEKVPDVPEEWVISKWRKSIHLLTQLHGCFKYLDLNLLTRSAICALVHLKIITNMAGSRSIYLEKLPPEVAADLMKFETASIGAIRRLSCSIQTSLSLYQIDSTPD